MPFNSIVLGLQALDEGVLRPDDHEARELVSMLRTAAKGMSSILDGALQLGAMEEGRFLVLPHARVG